MRFVLILLLLMSFASRGAEMKNLGPDNVSLSKRLLKMLAPQEEQKSPTQLGETRSPEISVNGANARAMNLKATDSHISNR